MRPVGLPRTTYELALGNLKFEPRMTKRFFEDGGLKVAILAVPPSNQATRPRAVAVGRAEAHEDRHRRSSGESRRIGKSDS